MNWGILLSTAKPELHTEQDVIDSTVLHAKSAERWGFDSAWVLEHHFTPYAINPDTLTLAGFLLGGTSRLRVGTAVLVAPFLHPVRIAESTALLDQLSDGRFHLGLGRGICREDFEVFGIDPAKSHELTRECVDLLVKSWTQEKVSGGGHYQFPEVSVVPKPRTTPRPAVHVAAESGSSVEWAATNGFPLLMQLGKDDQELASRVELYNEFAEAAGHDPETIEHVVMCIGHIGDSREAAKAEVFGLLEWWGEESSRIGFDVDDLKRLPNYRYHLNRVEQWVLEGKDTATVIDEWLDNSPVGTPEQCVERLKGITANTGARHVVLGLEGTGDAAVTEKNIERFATEVFPWGDHEASSG